VTRLDESENEMEDENEEEESLFKFNLYFKSHPFVSYNKTSRFCQVTKTRRN
jgi:hypothetical protein